VSGIPFVTLEDPRYGEAVQVSPLVRRVVARNPSKFTYLGTGTYVVGAGRDVAVVDPGPDDDRHRDALHEALRDRSVTAIVVTHCHADHSPLARWLAVETGAPTIAFGPHARHDHDDEHDDDGLPDVPADEPAGDTGPAPAAAAGAVKMEESTDLAFDPDVRVADGEVAAAGTGWTLRAVHTPGHTSNHLCLALVEERALFTGDHVMGWSTTVIGPPDGDMRAYLESLRRVAGRGDEVLWPTHGAPVTDPGPFLEAYLEHRLAREAQVLAAVRAGHRRIAPIVLDLYAAVRPQLHKPAARSVLAHLVKLVDDGVVAVEGGGRPRLSSTYLPA